MSKHPSMEGGSRESSGNHEVPDLFGACAPFTEDQFYDHKQYLNRSADSTTSKVDPIFDPEVETGSCLKPDWEDALLPPVGLDARELECLSVPDDDAGSQHSQSFRLSVDDDDETVSGSRSVRLFQISARDPDDQDDEQVVPAEASGSSWIDGSSSQGYGDSDTEELLETGCMAALDRYVPNYVPEE